MKHPTGSVKVKKNEETAEQNYNLYQTQAE